MASIDRQGYSIRTDLTRGAPRPPRPRSRRRAVALLALIVAAGCGPATGVPPVIEFGGETMGSTWSLKVVARRHIAGEERAAIDGAVRRILRQIETRMSTWNPESELSRFNRSTSLEPFPVAAETFEVFRWAVALSTETAGAFDVTVGPLVAAWGFGSAGAERAPAPDAVTVARLRATTGMQHLRLDPETRSVRKLHPEVQCDVSALVPGYAADRIAALLEARGLEAFLVDVGGEMVARGDNGAGRPWQIAIEHPGAAGEENPATAVRGAGAPVRVVPLTNAGIATSGDYRNYREVAGSRVTHIVDPRTGHPIAHRLASATVVDSRAVRADALATALMVLGPDEGLALAERLDLAALLLVRQPDGSFAELRSRRMSALLSSSSR